MSQLVSESPGLFYFSGKQFRSSLTADAARGSYTCEESVELLRSGELFMLDFCKIQMSTSGSAEAKWKR